MSEIKVEQPSEKKLEELGIKNWSPWECGPSNFNWEYASNETAYFYEGRVKIKTDSHEVEIKKGDLAFFPKGLRCRWNVLEKVRKVYKFS